MHLVSHSSAVLLYAFSLMIVDSCWNYVMQTSVLVNIQRIQPFTLGYMSLESPCKMLHPCLSLSLCTAADEVVVTSVPPSQSNRAGLSGTI